MGDRLRLFVAIAVPGAWLPELRRVRPAGGESDDRLHLTLHYLGRRSQAQTEQELATVRFAPFELDLDGLGTFGAFRDQVLWAGVRASQELRDLHGSVARALTDFQPDARPYRPHLTLGRGDPTGFREQDPPRGTTTVDRFHLWSSSDAGYLIEATYRAG